METSQHQQSIWDLVKECVPDSELPEIRTVLGEGLVDMYIEIYSEVQMWEQMWRDIQGERCRPQIPNNFLADPPAVKDLLRAELQLLLLTLQEKAARLGRDEDEVMSQYSPRVVSYVLCNDGRKGSQCETPCRRPPSGPSHSESRSSSRLSSRSNCEDEIEALKHKLNVTHIDEIVSRLKSYLTEECKVLKKDIQFLQESVELEYQKQREPELMEPTLRELKEERRIIQRDLHIQSMMSETSEKSGSSPDLSRETSFTGLLANDSEVEDPSTSLPPRNCLYPNPSPPGSNRHVHASKSRHRMSHKIMQLLPASPANSCPSHWTSTASTTDNHSLNSSASSATVWMPSSCSSEPREETHMGFPTRVAASRPAVGLDLRQPCDSSAAGTSVGSKQLSHRAEAAIARVLLPTPPAVQKAASRGQRANRRLVLPQAGNLLGTS